MILKFHHINLRDRNSFGRPAAGRTTRRVRNDPSDLRAIFAEAAPRAGDVSGGNALFTRDYDECAPDPVAVTRRGDRVYVRASRREWDDLVEVGRRAGASRTSPSSPARPGRADCKHRSLRCEARSSNGCGNVLRRNGDVRDAARLRLPRERLQSTLQGCVGHHGRQRAFRARHSPAGLRGVAREVEPAGACRQRNIRRGHLGDPPRETP